MPSADNKVPDYSGSLARGSIVLFVLLIMLATWILAVWRVRQDRNVTLENTRQELATFATGLGLQVDSMIGDVLASAMSGAAAMRYLDEEEVQQLLLAAMLEGGSHVRALFVQKAGRLVLAKRSTLPAADGSLPRASDLARTSEDIWFGEVQEDADGSRILPVARRLSGDSGNWAGAYIRISDLDELYRLLQRVQSTVGLITLRGVGLVQLPTSNQAYRNLDLSRTAIFQQFLRQPAQPLTWLDGVNGLTGKARLYAVYRLKNLPAITTSSRDVDNALSGWRSRTVVQMQFLVLFTAIVMALAIALQLLLNRRWQNLRGLAAAETQVADAQRAEIAVRQSLTRELLEAQERERQRLAGELHDGIGQDMAMLRNRVVLLRRADLPEAVQEHVAGVLDLATQVIEDLRTVAYNLRPMHLEELGLAKALRFLAERLEMSSELVVVTRIENVDDLLQGDAAMHVYRIAQEAINNVLRHADARNIWLDVTRDNGHVEMRISDDGSGISRSSDGGRGLGLSSISERAAILGASIELQPNVPSGTILILRIPLQPYNKVPAPAS